MSIVTEENPAIKLAQEEAKLKFEMSEVSDLLDSSESVEYVRGTLIPRIIETLNDQYLFENSEGVESGPQMPETIDGFFAKYKKACRGYLKEVLSNVCLEPVYGAEALALQRVFG